VQYFGFFRVSSYDRTKARLTHLKVDILTPRSGMTSNIQLYPVREGRPGKVGTGSR
jgi:hypothetical protein